MGFKEMDIDEKNDEKYEFIWVNDQTHTETFRGTADEMRLLDEQLHQGSCNVVLHCGDRHWYEWTYNDGECGDPPEIVISFTLLRRLVVRNVLPTVDNIVTVNGKRLKPEPQCKIVR